MKSQTFFAERIRAGRRYLLYEPMGRGKSGRSIIMVTAVSAVCLAHESASAVNLTSASALTQNFNDIGSSDTASLPMDWKMSAAGATNPIYSSTSNFSQVNQAASSGSPATGGRYNWGNGTTTSDRAVGFISSGSYSSPNSIMVSITNAASTTLTSAVIDFDIERYRINSSAANVTFYTSTDGSTWTARTAGNTGAFTTATSAYDFTNGTVVSRSVTLSDLSIAVGSSFFLRWNFDTTGGNSQGLGLDNFSMTGTFAPGSPGQYWDTSASAGVGGTGTWDETTANWNTLSDGNGSFVAYDAGQTARFAETAGTVTINGSGISANAGLSFEATGFTVDGQKLTLGGATAAANTIAVTTGTAVINADIEAKTATVTTGITKTGSGTLVLGGIVLGDVNVSDGAVHITGTVTGEGTIASGKTLQIGTGSGTGAFVGDIANAGLLVFNRTGTLSYDNVVSGTGTITKAGAGTLTLTGDNNNFTGAISVSTGVLNVGHNNALGTIAGSTSVSSGAALELQGGISTAEPVSIQGTGISSGGAIRNVSGNNLLSGLVSLGAASQINSDAGILTLGTAGSNATTGNYPLTLGGTGDIVVNGNLNNGGQVTKSGSGSLTLTGANGYTGTTTIAGGTLTVKATGGLGTPTSGTTVNSGSSLHLESSGSAITLSENITLNGQGVSNSGALRNVSGTNSVGTVALSTGARINSDSGTLTTGNVTGSNVALSIGGAGNVVLANVNLTGSGTLVKDGTGSLTLNNSTATGGGFFISNGDVVLGPSGSLGSSGSSLTVSGGTFSMNGRSATATSLSGSNSEVRNNSDASASTLTISPTSGTFTYNGNVVNGRAAVLSISKTAAGEQVFGGNNSYSGTTAISGGVLTASHNNALGDTAQGTAVSSGAALQLNHTAGISIPSGETISISGSGISSGGAIRNVAGNNTVGGHVALTNSARINSDAGTLTVGSVSGSNTSLTVGGAGSSVISGTVILGTGSITKDGAGTLTLNANNSFSGGLSVNAGIVRANNAGAMGSSAVRITDGAVYASASNPNEIVVNRVESAVQDFNSIGGGLPTGWSVRTGATTSSFGTVATFNTAQTTWGTSTGQFANFASALGLTSGSSTSNQNNSGNRAIGVRQTTGFGDPGAAFVYGFDSTGKTITGVSLDLMQLSAQSYSTTWTLQYATGESPSSWQTLDTFTDPGQFGTTNRSYNSSALQSALSNASSAWFRVIALSAASGTSGSRDTFAIDNFKLNVANFAATVGNDAIGEDVTYSGPITLNDGINLNAATDGITRFTGNITEGTPGQPVNKVGLGKVAVAGTNTYSGPTAVKEGTLQLGNAGTTGTLSTSSTVSVASGAKFAVNRTNAVVQGTDFSGSAITGSGGFEQAGTGKTTLNAPNTYAGGTTVSAGTLIAGASRVKSGSTLVSSSTGTGTVTINGGVLAGGGGTGSNIGVGSVVVNPGGTISAGSGAALPATPGGLSTDSIGNLTTSSQTWNADASGGATFVAKFDSASNHDTLTIDGALNLFVSDGSKFNIVLVKSKNFTIGTFDSNALTLETLVTATSITNGGTPYTSKTDLTDLFILDASNLGIADVVYKVFAEPSEAGLMLNVQAEAAPEPTTAVLIGLSGSILLGRRQRRRLGSQSAATGLLS